MLGRSGLTHSLLAWARCMVWCRDNNATLIAPYWFKLRLGPYLRGERDKRQYHRSFHSHSAISGLRRLWLLAWSRKLYAELDLPDDKFQINRDTIVVFRNAERLNERKFFHFIQHDSDYLRSELEKITRPNLLHKVVKNKHIAIHIRRGDFSISKGEKFEANATNTQIPIEWYCTVLERLRVSLGSNLPAIVYSDGADFELKKILTMDGVFRSQRADAIVDLLSIANSAVLVASISGFSQWGSFLGSVPIISYPGQALFDYLESVDNETESDGTYLDPLFINRIVIDVTR